MILALKTSDPVTEIYLLDSAGKIISQKIWSTGRRLANELLGEIERLVDSKWSGLSGLIVFTGPGSFTGLRIGITVMNSLAYSLSIQVVGTNNNDWLQDGIKRLVNNENDKIIIPEYGALPNISQPKK